MRLSAAWLALGALAASAQASATEFGVMETATLVKPGHIKFEAYPLWAQPLPTQEERSGTAVGFGYGISEWVDAELQFATYDDATFVGGDLEHMYYEGDAFAASIGAGVHGGSTDFGEQRGADLTHVLTYSVNNGTPLWLNLGLDLAYDKLDRTRGAVTRGLDEEWWSAHLVPGLQYRLNRAVDLIGEIGVGLNGDARRYAAAGLSIYFDR